MADNSDEGDELQLDEEDQQFIAQDIKNGTAIVETKDSLKETNQSDTPGTVSHETLVDVPNFRWRKNSYMPYEFGSINLFSDRKNMLTPMDTFMELTQLDKLVTDIECIRYAEQNGRPLTIISKELKAFLGMNFVMSYHVLPTIRNYWSTDGDIGVPFIANVMPRANTSKFAFLQRGSRMKIEGQSIQNQTSYDNH